MLSLIISLLQPTTALFIKATFLAQFKKRFAALIEFIPGIFYPPSSNARFPREYLLPGYNPRPPHRQRSGQFGLPIPAVAKCSRFLHKPYRRQRLTQLIARAYDLRRALRPIHPDHDASRVGVPHAHAPI